MAGAEVDGGLSLKSCCFGERLGMKQGLRRKHTMMNSRPRYISFFHALSTAHHSTYRICIFWSHLIPRHGSSTYDAAHFPSPSHHGPQIRTILVGRLRLVFGSHGHSEDGWGCTFPSGLFMHGRTAFVLWSPITMDSGGGEERLASHWNYTPFFVYFPGPRRGQTGARYCTQRLSFAVVWRPRFWLSF